MAASTFALVRRTGGVTLFTVPRRGGAAFAALLALGFAGAVKQLAPNPSRRGFSAGQDESV